MSTIYKVLHLNTNTILYEPIETDEGSFGQYSNTVGHSDYSYETVGLGVAISYLDTFTPGAFLTEGQKSAIYNHIRNLKRNGPYGYPSWKQIRTGENAVFRTHRKNNILTFINHPVEKIIIQNGKRHVVSHRDDTIQVYDEPPVVAKHKPLEIMLSRPLREGGSPFPFLVKVDFNNNLNMMTNKEVNSYAKAVLKKPDSYDSVKSMYLNGGLEDPSSPISGFSYLRFNQTIFPAEKYTFKKANRIRVSFPSEKFWKDVRHKRSSNSKHEAQGTDGFWFDGLTGNTSINRSAWPLDVSTEWLDRTSHPLIDDSTIQNLTDSSGTGIGGYNIKTDFGILQNNYVNYLSGGVNSTGTPIDFGTFGQYGGISRPGVLYNRKHRYTTNYSSIAATGKIDLLGPSFAQTSLFAGEAYWQAPSQANRNPFDDNIEVFTNLTKRKYKNYGVLPEYSIDKHIDFYIENGIKTQNLDLFSFPDALVDGEDLSISSENDFYKIFSTSDFLKNFDLIIEDHKNFADPSIIKLTCNAVLKLMPYDGFYPAQRSVDLGESFYNSYKNNLIMSSSIPGIDGIRKTNITGFDIFNKPFMQSMFSPGIWFNTIKSGIAVDCAIPSKSLIFISASDGKGASIATANPFSPDGTNPIALSGLGYGGAYYIDGGDSMPHVSGTVSDDLYRVPFECMVEPETFLENRELFDLEPHHSSSAYPLGLTTGSYGVDYNKQVAIIWDGKGNINYKKMANNFLSEIPEFFLENKNFTTFKSLPQGSDQFGNFEAGKRYSMRIKIGKTFKNGDVSFPISPACNNSHGTVSSYKPPSITRHMLESASIAQSDWPEENITMYSRPTAFGPPFTAFAHSSNPNIQNYTGVKAGSNYTWTPPYYEGSAYAHIEFAPTETKKYTIQELLKLCEIEYYRYYHDDLETMPYRYFDSIAMQISASVNIFNVETPDDKGSVLFVSSSNTSGIQNDKSRLCIQTKFETPILNFNSIDPETLIAPAGNSVKTVGMWHQFGLIPTKDELIYLEIEDIPDSWYLSLNPSKNKDPRESLADALGFEKSRRRLGELAKSKKIKEAVVAVPFYDKGSERKFFRIPRIDIENAIDNKEQQKLVGSTIIDMVKKMKQYNFPPSMDFLTYKDIDPFAMYIFEFEHVLSRQDLSYIWQNMLPDIGVQHKEASATISHELLAHELLGGGSRIVDTGGGKILDESAKGKDFNPEIRWMVFKVKYKAKHDYYEKIIGKRSNLDVSTANLNYNWPYDFFSLVELVKLDASVELSEIEKDEKTGSRILKPTNSLNSMPATRSIINGIKNK